MAFFRRIYCHFCGTRSPYSKSSGIADFQCSSCEAINYLDSKGEITDTPATAMVQSSTATREQSPPFQTFTQQLPSTLDHQRNQAFCSTCVTNQRMYMEAISNYLPDEEDPRYEEYENALPQFKEELERRYPQVCMRCAPIAQRKINRSDYYAGTQNISKMAEATARGGVRSARGTRDDWWKWSMRKLLDAVGVVLNVSLLLQVVWHAYGIFALTATGAAGELTEDMGLDFDPMPHNCVQESLQLRFSHACYRELGAYLPRTLLAALCLIWYNPGLKDWYHHTYRIESIAGQTEHFRMQALLLAVRAIAWYKLSDQAFVKSLTTQQSIAAQGFVAAFMLLVQWLSGRAVKSTRFKLRQKMMPRPEDSDVLSAYAGPGTEDYERQASSIPPTQLFARERLDRITPFPIGSLAAKQAPRHKPTSPSSIPSPPPSDETDDEGDPMEIDDQPSASRSRMPGTAVDRIYRPKAAQKRSDARSFHNHSSTQPAGWSGMRDEIFGVQDQLQVQAERKRKEVEEKARLRFQPPVQQSPFRGRLPPAPMSLERRLRNPITQLAFKETPVSKQRDFMQQMRDGIGQGKGFANGQAAGSASALPGLSLDDRDEDFSPIKSRTRGGLELKQSAWQLKDERTQATGLEDLFGGTSFRIKDEPAITLPASQRKDTRRLLKLVVGITVPVAVVVVSWRTESVRRA
ncbi:hypothetical protein LTR53_016848, partial [Teratosphaeriaceae sp. CCFEE 6253]